ATPGKSSQSVQIEPSTVHRPPSTAYRIKKIVLDAGHGGKDPGCSGAHSKEKHNALAVVLKLGAFVEANFPEIQVIYTRKTDVFVELNERAAIANRENADLFISVHCNSVGAKHIHGTETYVMGLHTAQHNLEVAKRENAAIFYEKDYQKNYEGYDPNSAESHIFSALWQSAYLEQSILFASFVQHFANSIAGRDDKGVKQAGFLVLRETAMPAVLVETGYLTSRVDEDFLASEEGQSQMAEAIFEAFKSYKRQMEGEVAAQEPAPKKSPAPKPAVPVKQTSGGQASVQKTNLPTDNVTEGARLLRESKPDSTEKQPEKAQKSPKTRILLETSKTKLDLTDSRFDLISDIKEVRAGTAYQYFVGTFADRKEAELMLSELKNLGFKKAEIVAADGK
ncbi:MAG: N-acetylmuramoyl-L-alanine amidase, partial [Saprospiraceae bacterium]